MFYFRFNIFTFICFINHKILYFEFIIFLILLFFVQVYYKIIIFRLWIISFTILFIGINFLNFFRSKWSRRFVWTFFLYELNNPLYIFWDWLFLGLIPFLESNQLFFFLLFLRVMSFWSSVTLILIKSKQKDPSCPWGLKNMRVLLFFLLGSFH